jgi:protein-disulfide isomerase
MTRRLTAIVILASFLTSLTMGPLRAADQPNDPVLAVLQPMAEAAAAANVTKLMSDPDTPVIGNPHATVAIVEFFDYQCSFCKASEPKLQAMVKDDPNLKLVIKEFPILSPESITASKAALAAVKQGKYTAYHQALMAYKGQLKEDTIFQIAGQVGLDVDRLRRDMVAPEIADQIIANMSLARALKISVTPGLLVNTHILSGVSKLTESGKIDFKKEVELARAH